MTAGLINNADDLLIPEENLLYPDGDPNAEDKTEEELKAELSAQKGELKLNAMDSVAAAMEEGQVHTKNTLRMYNIK